MHNHFSKYSYINKNDIMTDLFETPELLPQEVQDILPQAVDLAPFDTEYENGEKVSKSGENYLTIQYERLVPLLVEAIKEQQEQIQNQQKQIDELKARLEVN
jgi:hypothetical protein